MSPVWQFLRLGDRISESRIRHAFTRRRTSLKGNGCQSERAVPKISRRRGFFGLLGAAVAAAYAPEIKPLIPTVKGASQTGSTLLTHGWSSSNALRTGDVFTIAGVNSVNPITHHSTGISQRFVVTAAAQGDRAGVLALNVSPHVIPYQTVDLSPANDAAITPL